MVCFTGYGGYSAHAFVITIRGYEHPIANSDGDKG